MRFKIKPTEIEAEQYREGQPLPHGVCTGQCAQGNARIGSDAARPHVHTMHDNQSVVLKDGDWVVPEPDGKHFYPIDDEVFRRKYEPI